MVQTFFRNELEDLGVLLRNMKEQNIVSKNALNSWNDRYTFDVLISILLFVSLLCGFILILLIVNVDAFFDNDDWIQAVAY